MSVELTINGHIAEIVLNNPDKRNVLDCVSSAQLAKAVAEAEANQEVSCLIIAATGRAFCAGGSLDELIRAQAGETELLHDIYAGFLAVANSPLPTIAAVQGAAVGAGMNLALACDIGWSPATPSSIHGLRNWVSTAAAATPGCCKNS